jgi:hypothetical protein
MGFMVPEIVKGSDLLSLNLTARDLGIDDLAEDKYYARLSAPGYLDATDWSGPYATHEEANEGICEEHDLCPTCHEEGYGDCATCDDEDTEYTNGLDDNGTAESTWCLEPVEAPPVTCRLCGDPTCTGH